MRQKVRQDETCCAEYTRVARTSRRVFVRAGGLAMVSWGLTPPFVARALAAREAAASRKVLVCVFLRGAVDGLSMVVPYGERRYYELRDSVAIDEPGRGGDRALDLDGFFGLHPALAPLQPLYQEGRLAIVPAVGSPDASRSHFDAQDYMESGTPGVKTTRDGWLNRLLGEIEGSALTGATALMRALALTAQPPRSLDGRQPALTVGDLQQFLRRRNAGGFEALYGSSGNDLVVSTGADALDAVSALRAADPLRYLPANGARYPSGLGRQLQQVAQLIKADIGLQVAFADADGWDTHRRQGGARGQLANRLSELGQALAAFCGDLGERMDDVVLLTMSEFGRTAAENGSEGTDHGHATVSLLLGGPVNGGRVYGRWPGLAPEQLFEGRDLAVTTDFRDLFGEVADAHLAPADRDALFPGYPLDPSRYLGLLR